MTLTTIAAPADGPMTAVCPTHGTVYWVAQGCPKCRGRSCAGCAALQQQIDDLRKDFADQIAALDRGLIEAAEIAHRALTATQSLGRWRDKQEKAWSTFSDGKTAAEKARDDQQDAARSAARRRVRARSARPVAPSSRLSLVAPGGAA